MEPVGRLAQSWPASQSRPASSRFASRIIRTQYYVKQDNQTSYISQETSIPAAMRAQRQDWKYSSPFHSGPVRAEKRWLALLRLERSAISSSESGPGGAVLGPTRPTPADEFSLLADDDVPHSRSSNFLHRSADPSDAGGGV